MSLIQILVASFADAQVKGSDLGLPSVSANDATLKTVLSIVFVFIGGWTLLFILIGAMRYILSGGDPGNIKQAKDTILYAAIGLALSLMAFSIVQFVLGKVG